MRHIFRNIYLGETFMSYISLHNDSSDCCDSVFLVIWIKWNYVRYLLKQTFWLLQKCDLQTATQRMPLISNSSSENPARLSPGESIDNVLSHEVFSLYLLTSFLKRNNESKSFLGKRTWNSHSCVWSVLQCTGARKNDFQEVFQVSSDETFRCENKIL